MLERLLARPSVTGALLLCAWGSSVGAPLAAAPGVRLARPPAPTLPAGRGDPRIRCAPATAEAAEPAGFRARADELAERLAALAAPESATRAAAERWLAGHVEPADAGALAAALAGGDAEVGRRLVHVLARAPRGLDLAALLVERGGPDAASIAAVAEDALRERWAATGVLEFPALRAKDLLSDALELWASLGATSTIRLELTGTLADSAALLEREARTFLGLAVEPALRGRRPIGGAPRILEGPWNRVCLALREAYGVEAEVHGLPLQATDTPPASPTFLVFTEPGRAAQSDERVLAWFRAVVLETDAARRADAALALVSSEWPDALAWLERRFLEGSDGAVLEALLHAATTGRVVPALLDPARVRSLVALAERETAQAEGAGRSSARVELVLRALAALPPIGRPAARGAAPEAADGGPSSQLADAVLEGWEGASPRGRWVRLVALEGMGSPLGAAPAREVLADAAAPVGLALQALRTLAAAGGADGPAPAVVARLRAASADPAEAAELGRTLARAGFAPGDEPPARTLPALLAELAWALQRGDAPRAGNLWRAALSGTDPSVTPAAALEAVCRALRVVARTVAPADLAAAWRAARAAAGRAGEQAGGALLDALDRSAIRSGRLPAARVVEILDGARATKGDAWPDGSDLDLLAVLAGLGGHPTAIRARSLLVDGLRDALQANAGAAAVEARLPTLERAVDELLRNGLDGAADELVRAIDLLRVQHRRAKEAVAALAAWPPAPRLSEVDLVARARRFALPDLGPGAAAGPR